MTDENTSEPVGSGPRYRIYSRMPDDTWQGSGTGGPFDRFDTAMWFVKREENRWPKEIFRITAFKGDVVYETDAAPPAREADAGLDFNDLTPAQRDKISYAGRNALVFKPLPMLKTLARRGWLVEDEVTRGGYRLTAAGRAARDAHFAAPAATADAALSAVNDAMADNPHPGITNRAANIRDTYDRLRKAEAERDAAQADAEALRAALAKIDVAAASIDARVMSLVEIASEPDAWTQYRITSEDKLVVIDRIDNQITHYLGTIKRAASADAGAKGENG
jgi:hypothetical protein